VARVPVVKTKKRHGERGPGKRTVLTKAALNAAAADPAITPSEFLLGVMRDPAVDTRWRMDAAKALLPKPSAAPAPDSGPMVIDGMTETDRARIETRIERRDHLADKSLLACCEIGPALTPEERAEYEGLEAWRDGLPRHLKGQTLGEWLDDAGGSEAARPARRYEDPA
jgi:hypothetical protein